ncbi:MAG: hypothetical protein CL908_19535 [Deltaproteobacteria bacterium]|nr:hypothetical protein [Deltaproteobacteria bacterium]
MMKDVFGITGALVALGVMSTAEVEAFPSFGTQVDQYCTANGRTPSMPSNGDCSTCHNASDPGSGRTALFDSYRQGDFDAFCPASVNSPPSFLPIPPQSMTEDGLLSIDVIATDPDDDSLMLEAANLPTGAVFEDLGTGIGRLVWMPTFEQAGSYVVNLRATDDGTPPESGVAEMLISVGDVNRPPSLASIGAQTVLQEETLRVLLSATDLDGDRLTFGSAGLPAGALLTDAGDGTGELSWTPTSADVGSVPVTITVTDDGVPMASDAEEFAITVGAVNQPPVLDAIGDRMIAEGEDVSILLAASDPNADPLFFECLGAPIDFRTIDAGDGTASLVGRAGFDESGNYDVTCSVSDDATPPATDEETFTLSVGDVNRPPTLDPIGMTREGEMIVLRLTASDPDGDTLAFEAVGVPIGANLVDFADGTAELTWVPDAGTVGEFPIDFTVFDDGSPVESDQRSFTISIEPPQLSIPSVRQARWNKKRQTLRVAGGGAAPGETVELIDGATGIVLGEVRSDRRGRFRAALALVPSSLPCTLAAVGADGAGEPVPVIGAPRDCPVN